MQHDRPLYDCFVPLKYARRKEALHLPHLRSPKCSRLPDKSIPLIHTERRRGFGAPSKYPQADGDYQNLLSP